MESTMCHDDGVDFPAASSPSPILHLFTAYYKNNVASLFLSLFFAAARMQLHLSVLACVSRVWRRCLPGRALFPHPPYPTSSSAPAPVSCRLISPPPSHRLPQIPIGDGSALEFIPHHPAEL